MPSPGTRIINKNGSRNGGNEVRLPLTTKHPTRDELSSGEDELRVVPRSGSDAITSVGKLATCANRLLIKPTDSGSKLTGASYCAEIALFDLH